MGEALRDPFMVDWAYSTKQLFNDLIEKSEKRWSME